MPAPLITVNMAMQAVTTDELITWQYRIAAHLAAEPVREMSPRSSRSGHPRQTHYGDDWPLGWQGCLALASLNSQPYNAHTGGMSTG